MPEGRFDAESLKIIESRRKNKEEKQRVERIEYLKERIKVNKNSTWACLVYHADGICPSADHYADFGKKYTQSLEKELLELEK